MPLSSDRVGGINTSPIAGIGGETITPAVSDLMQAFRSGFVTVEDLAKRGAQLPVELEKSRQELQDVRQIRPLARQAQAGALGAEIEIQPLRRELQLGQIQQEIRGLPTPGEEQASEAERARAAQIRNSLASPDRNVRLNTIASLTNEETETVWTAAHGQTPPDQLEVPGTGGITPKPIDEWYLENVGEHPPGTRAIDNLNRPEIQAAYQRYTQEAKTRSDVVFKGTPEYFQALKKDLTAAKLEGLIQQAYIKSIPDFLKAIAEAPAKQAEAQSKAQSDLLTELHKSDVLKRFEKQFEAFNKVNEIKNSGRTPTNADDIALMYEFVKVLDPDSAVREGEAKLSQSTNPAVIQLYNQGKALFVSKDKILGSQARADMIATLDSLRIGAEKTVAPEIKRISGIAIDRGVPLDQVFTGPFQSILSSRGTRTAPAPAEGVPSGQPGAVPTPQPGDEGTLKDGRKIKITAVGPNGITFDVIP